ncbi:hypothetical protein ACHQM5_025083 [Ranunculus cassubicifolius]
MADALITVVLEQLSSYILSEVALVIDTREEVVKLTGNLKLVQAVLADAEEKQVKNKSVKVWLDDLKQVVYDADDVLDAWRTRTAISQLQVPNDLFNKFACLRTLVLQLEVLPNEVEKMVHLRYLDLSGSELHELPETICNIYNLQVLILNECSNLSKLPEKIGMLSNLRHLEIEKTYCLRCFPKSIAKLSSLRTLSKFVVSDADHEGTIGDLQLLNNLGGVLKLNRLCRVADENDADRAELNKKKNLRELVFEFKAVVSEGSCVRMGMKKILEKLEPHGNLEILEIRDYPDSQFPGWVHSCLLLSNIVEVRLFSCEQCMQLPAFGKLASLKKLKIKGMSSVTRIGSEFYGVVYLWYLPHSRLPKGFDQIKSLQSIEFYYCSTLNFDLKELGHFTMLQHLEITQCPLLSQRFKGDDW